MRKLLLLLLIMTNFCFGQKPIVTFVSQNNVVGFADFKTIVRVDYIDKITGQPVSDTTLVKSDNKFNVKLTKAPLDIGTSVIVYYENSSKKEPYLVKGEKEIVNDLTIKGTMPQLPYFREVIRVNALNAEKDALKNTTLLYRTTIWSTNFSVPLVRFNFVTGDDRKQGDILLFNSIGAGIGHYWGRLERTRDNTGEIINEEFSNSIGFNFGFLFSAGTGEDNKNVFAPVFNFAVLDLQLGVGVELGTRLPNQKREFVTLSYAIPLYKLFKKGYRLSKNIGIPFESVRKTQG